jgi:hypothetical protein
LQLQERALGPIPTGAVAVGRGTVRTACFIDKGRGVAMAVSLSIVAGVIAYEFHKRKKHSVGIVFDITAVLFIWRIQGRSATKMNPAIGG